MCSASEFSPLVFRKVSNWLRWPPSKRTTAGPCGGMSFVSARRVVEHTRREVAMSFARYLSGIFYGSLSVGLRNKMLTKTSFERLVLARDWRLRERHLPNRPRAQFQPLVNLTVSR